MNSCFVFQGEKKCQCVRWMEEDERGQEGQIRDNFYTKDCEILHVLASFILV